MVRAKVVVCDALFLAFREAFVRWGVSSVNGEWIWLFRYLHRERWVYADAPIFLMYRAIFINDIKV